MSSFIVKPETINRIVTFLDTKTAGSDLYASSYRDLLKEYGLAPIDDKGMRILMIETDEWPQTLAKKLLDLNIEAVHQRYGDTSIETMPGKVGQKLEDYAYRFNHSTLVQVYKSVQCLSYQCAEGNVPETQLYKFLEDLENTLAKEIVSALTEYNKAAWD
jgi:hypothetical protein